MTKHDINFGTYFSGKAVGLLDYGEVDGVECNVLTVDGVQFNFDDILKKCYGGEIEFKATVPIEESEE